MKALIFDTETTGLLLHPNADMAAQPRIIEFACVIIENDIELGHAVQTFNPGTPLSPEIVKITGLTDEDLKDSPPFAEFIPKIVALLEKVDCVVAHNLPFDSGMIDLEFDRAAMDAPWPLRRICTVQEHAEAWGYRPKLTELYEHYTGKKLEQTHRALDDVRALAEVVKRSGVLKLWA